MSEGPRATVTRRDVLKLGSVAAAAAGLPGALAPARAEAQAPKRGGTFRICTLLEPVGFDPQQTISFTTHTLLSFAHSRLVKVKAGPSVRPGTYPIEPDVAESWSQPNETTYVFKLKRGVRWHPKPPVNGRELTADDVKYTYERFLGLKNNGNRATLEVIDRIEVVDRHTVRFVLREPQAWFLDLLASTSTWLIAREAVEQFGDLKRPEAVIGTGPWMLERYEPGVRVIFVRHPSYFVAGLPYADGVEVGIDRDPASRLSSWLGGKYDFAPEYQQVVRRLDLDLARQRKPNLQTAEYVWFTGGYSSFKIDQAPFSDVRFRRALGRASSWKEVLDTNAFSMGHGSPNTAVPAASAEWAIPLDQLTKEGRELYEYDPAEARRLLAQAGVAVPFKVPVETTPGYGPDYLDSIQVTLKNWKSGGIEGDLKLKEYGAFIASTIYGKFDRMMTGLRGAWTDPESYLYRAFMPEQPLNSSGINDARLTEMIRLQRRTPDVAKRREIVHDIQRLVAHQAYGLYGPSVKVVTAWDSYVKNFGPNNGFDYGGRLMAAWLDR
jgi:peptide/nickel transport system substrate-binding protein